MELVAGKVIARKTVEVVFYEEPPEALWVRARMLYWSRAHALEFCGVEAEDRDAVIEGRLCPESDGDPWEPMVRALSEEYQRQVAVMAPLLVADGEWARDADYPGWEDSSLETKGTAWDVTLHTDAGGVASVLHHADGTWSIDDVGGAGAGSIVRAVIGDLEADGETDFMWDESCWHPALRGALGALGAAHE
jgi:hypothetical protein